MTSLIIPFLQFVKFFQGFEGNDYFILLKMKNAFRVMNKDIGIKNVCFSSYATVLEGVEIEIYSLATFLSRATLLSINFSWGFISASLSRVCHVCWQDSIFHSLTQYEHYVNLKLILMFVLSLIWSTKEFPKIY
jgi:hypothetical protein